MNPKKKVRFQLPVITINDNFVPNKRPAIEESETVTQNGEILFFYPKFPQLVPVETNVNKTKQRHIKHCWICSSVYSDKYFENQFRDLKKWRPKQNGYQSSLDATNLLLKIHLPVFPSKLNKKVSKFGLNLYEDFYSWKRSQQKKSKQRPRDKFANEDSLYKYCEVINKIY